MTEGETGSELQALRSEVLHLRALLRQRGVSAADNATASTRRDYQHDRYELTAEYEQFVRDAEFNREVLENTTDCIKVLDLDGRLEFMSAGGMRVMEIDDFSDFAMCPWTEFWRAGERHKINHAIALAKAGEAARFEGQAPTAKGHLRWWDVSVSPIMGPDGKPQRLLSISRDITERHAAEEGRRVLVDEMRHRIKNTLTTIQGIVQLSLRQAGSLSEAAQSIEQRLVAMGKAHDLLIHNDWVGADLNQIVTDTVRAYVGDGTQMSVVGEPVQLSSRAALSVAMLLNELCTNAVKYGAWSRDVGVVAISWAKAGTAFRFRWEEQGGPAVTPPSRRGFGTRLITEILPSALGGKGTLGFSTSGCVFELELPVSALNAV